MAAVSRSRGQRVTLPHAARALQRVLPVWTGQHQQAPPVHPTARAAAALAPRVPRRAVLSGQMLLNRIRF